MQGLALLDILKALVSKVDFTVSRKEEFTWTSHWIHKLLLLAISNLFLLNFYLTSTFCNRITGSFLPLRSKNHSSLRFIKNFCFALASVAQLVEAFVM